MTAKPLREVNSEDYFHLSSAAEGNGVRHAIHSVCNVTIYNVEANGQLIATELKPGGVADWWEPNPLGYDVVEFVYDIPKPKRRRKRKS